MPTGYEIKLSKTARAGLKRQLVGKTTMRVGRRARILLLAGEGRSVEAIATLVGCGTATVKRIKARYRVVGWAEAIVEKPRPGRRKQEPTLIALACSEPPKGYARWTVRLLAAKSGLGRMTVQRLLETDGIKPWREKNVVRCDD